MKCNANREFLEEQYVQLRKSLSKISKEFGWAQSTIQRKIKRLGLSRTVSESNKGEFNGKWKGDKVKYGALHDWVRSHKPKVEFCECCGISPPQNLANISQEYHRDVNDFEWLCVKCHMKKDGRMERNIERTKNGKINKRRN